MLPPAGGVTFSPPKKSPKSRLKPRFQDFLFAEVFMKAKQVFAPFGTLFSIAVLTLQCAACPAAQHFFARDTCHGHCAMEYSAPAGAGGYSALRRGLLFARTKSNQKFAKTYGFGIPSFAEDFMKRIAAARRSVRCLSTCRTDFPRTHTPLRQPLLASRWLRQAGRCLEIRSLHPPQAALRSFPPGGPRRAQGRALFPRSFGTMLAAGIDKF